MKFNRVTPSRAQIASLSCYRVAFISILTKFLVATCLKCTTCCGYCDACDISALSSSAARCLARETQMRQLVGASDGEIRPMSQPQEVSTVAENIVRLQECYQSPAECSQPQWRQSAASVKPAESKIITEAMAVVTERLSWATDELRRASSIETSCQLCMLIRSCADAIQALQRVGGVWRFALVIHWFHSNSPQYDSNNRIMLIRAGLV